MFVDECGTHTSMTRLLARAPRGERAYGKVPRNRGKNTTLLASMNHEGMGPSMAVVGSTTKAVFEAYVERMLAPSLRPGQVVVMDNLGAHRSERVRELIEERGLFAFVPAALLAGLLAHRRGFQQDKGAFEEGQGQDAPGARRGHRPGFGCG